MTRRRRRLAMVAIVAMTMDRQGSSARSLVIPAVLLLAFCFGGCATPTEEPDPAVSEPTEAVAAAAAEEDEPRGLRLTTPHVSPGYVLHNPNLSDATYLIDVEGRVVHTWQSDYGPGGGSYLLENGHLLRAADVADAPVFSGGGQAGRIQEFTWDGEVVWEFIFATEDHRLHHDMAVLPNGNLLGIAWEHKSADEATAAGRRPELTPEAGLWPDMIVEIEPQPPDGGRVVWTWHMWDHTLQNHDPELSDYGEPAEHPELIDINGDQDTPELSAEELARLRALGYVPSDTDRDDLSSDFMHTNAVAYNAELDQIVLSVPRFNEIWVIDHSTTTAEAAGHTGGRWGRGGDLLYRWGNPRTYGRGGAADQRLFFQHDVQWVPESMPGAGHLTLFNNNIEDPAGNYSAVFELAPPVADAGGYVVPEDEPFGPSAPVWSYTAPDKVSFYSFFISGAHRLLNGNTFITDGRRGRFLEVTSEGEIVWEYLTPYAGDGEGNPTTLANPHSVFRATKLPPDHPALAGRALAPVDPQPPVVLPAAPES